MIKHPLNEFLELDELELDSRESNMQLKKSRHEFKRDLKKKERTQEFTVKSETFHDQENYPEDYAPDYMSFDVGGSILSTSESSGMKNVQEAEVAKQENNLDRSLFETSSTSIGLSIMKKMGFEIGTSLGRLGFDRQNLNLEPVRLRPKVDKAGLGATGNKFDENLNTEKYRDRRIKEKKVCKLNRDICELSKICFEISGDLDRLFNDPTSFDIEEINPLWKDYAFERKIAETKSSSKIGHLLGESENNDQANIIVKDSSEEDVEEKLMSLLNFLRREHFYCWYCGAYFLDERDMDSSCPGISEQHHLLL
ncbi:uncharacterized protein PRCAT00001638001 [Priceomyces carsonii]|uniref:uncharacterized protein n=1 Tax=Priceomyces carsonii TaxID=28549 RepID=UPI002ED80203|nr:unnamed protein product [Priceomyces carsonii]